MHGYPTVLFSTSTRANFTWLDGYDDVSTFELKELIVECDIALGSLKAELSSRQEPSDSQKAAKKFKILKSYCEDLRNTADRIKTDGLTSGDYILLRHPISNQKDQDGDTVLQSKGRKEWAQNAYEEFIWLVSRLVSPGLALLVKFIITRNKIKNLDFGHKAKLIQYISQNKDILRCSVLETEATVAVCKKRKNDERWNITHRDDSGYLCGNETSVTNRSLDTDHIFTPNPLNNATSFSTSSDNFPEPQSSYAVSSTVHPPVETHHSRSTPERTCDSMHINHLITKPQNNCRSLSEQSLGSIMRQSLNQMAGFHNHNVKALCTDEPKAVYLLLLLRFLVRSSGALNTSILDYGGLARKRWAISGELEMFRAHDVGLHQDIADLLGDSKELGRNLRLLHPLAHTRPETSSASTSMILEADLCREIDALMDSSTEVYWHNQALILTSFLFTGSAFTKSFGDIGRLTLPHFQGLISEDIQSANGKYWTTPLMRVVVDGLLGSSGFSDIAWKTQALRRVSDIGGQGLEDYAQARFVQRQSFVLRVTGNPAKSSKVIEDYFSNRNAPADNPRLNAQHLLLKISLARSFYEREDFDSAIDILEWQLPLETPPTYLLSAMRKTMILKGMIEMNKGNYQLAQSRLEAAWQTNGSDSTSFDMSGSDVLSSLSDVYCELGRPEIALTLLQRTIRITQVHSRLHLREYRNLLVSFAEASVCAARYEQAETILCQLKRYFDKTPSNDTMNQQRHLRTLILYAQNRHHQSTDYPQWAETLKRWDAVVALSQKYAIMADTGMDYAVIRLSMCHVARELEQHEQSDEHFRVAAGILKAGGHFWRRGLGTYWLEFLRPRLSYLQAQLLSYRSRNSQYLEKFS